MMEQCKKAKRNFTLSQNRQNRFLAVFSFGWCAAIPEKPLTQWRGQITLLLGIMGRAGIAVHKEICGHGLAACHAHNFPGRRMETPNSAQFDIGLHHFQFIRFFDDK